MVAAGALGEPAAHGKSTASRTARRGSAPLRRALRAANLGVPDSEGAPRMSPLKRSNNIAARMGRWSASHWKTAVFGWLAFVIASLAIGSVVSMKSLSNEDSTVGQSHKAEMIVKNAGVASDSDPRTERVVVR